ncbi:MAG: PDGLE domain-containing protein [Candidatus Latescibacterota bacterium]
MKKFVLIMLAVSLAVAGGISYFASSHPDGLERVAENLGFLDKAKEPSHSVLPDYTVPGLGGFLSHGLAGIIGVLATFGITVFLTRLVRKNSLSQRREDAKKR